MTVMIVYPQEVIILNSRICQVRKYSGLNQTEFAEKLSLTKNYISLIENGNRTPSDRTISDICREFNVNEDWLRTGEGEMLKPVNRDAAIASFMGDVLNGEDADFRRRMISVLSSLDVTEWELLAKVARKLADDEKKEDQA